MAEVPETVAEAVALLARDGYTEDFNLRGTSVVCARCQSGHDLRSATIERQYRFEGPSDPGDEAIVLGLSCPSCDRRGVLVSAFGPDADPDVLLRLRSPDR